MGTAGQTFGKDLPFSSKIYLTDWILQIKISLKIEGKYDVVVFLFTVYCCNNDLTKTQFSFLTHTDIL